ncbi:putative damage-inducible protein DinB [Pontibacter aydingkolensis]|uniref:DinB family protein n=1 Tax=Pontibacter aydingkolensis TaxID=1911536 RepID=A0ABS7CVN5_9BACT|nr:DinB family protein [Pontibacter aydingkolensis]MBW7467906.1 DinB family protein [Pontibacter aydingkolensis]
MNPRLEIKYLNLEKSRNRLLDVLEGLDDDILNTPPAEGKWSINQIIYHLIEVEKLTTGYVANKLQKKESLVTSSFTHSFKSLLLKLALRSGRKYKAPAVVADVPDTVMLHKMRQHWDDTRFKLEDVLNEVPGELMDKCLFKHPYVGPLSITQTLSFLQDHFDHHERQIQQLMKNLVKL